MTQPLTDIDQIRALAATWKSEAEIKRRLYGEAAAFEATGWEYVHSETLAQVRRIRVPGGWLYQTEIDELHEPLRVDETNTRVSGWSDPLFVPEPR